MRRISLAVLPISWQEPGRCVSWQITALLNKMMDHYVIITDDLGDQSIKWLLNTDTSH